MKYYMIAGERSGDLHASNLIKAIRAKDAQAEFRAIGGDYMSHEGVNLYRHYKEIAFMGIWEVFKNLNRINKIFETTTKDIQVYHPDVLILVDFGGFNMKMARFAKEKGIKVYYYISPKIWAWYTSRAYKIKKFVDRMFVILPFEKKFYERFSCKVDYVGNPVCDAVYAFQPDPFFKEKHGLSNKPVVAILAGSRYQEVKAMLNTMLKVIPALPQYQFVIAGVSNVDVSLYNQVERSGGVVITSGTYDILHIARAAIVTSGTATLETALFKVPQVVCYSTSLLTYLIKVKYISLVNLIADKLVVNELIQKDFTQKKILEEIRRISEDGSGRNKIMEGYKLVIDELGNPGASEKTATLMLQYLQTKSTANTVY
jgi:lipid-A-disaccharide synthase